MFIKSIAAAVAATAMGAGSAFAGPYVNIENNTGYAGNDYKAAITDFHVGYEGDITESVDYYVQAGPAIVAQDGEDTTTEISGKAGIGAGIADNVSAYGEIAFITVDGSDDADYNLKAGVTYRF